MGLADFVLEELESRGVAKAIVSAEGKRIIRSSTSQPISSEGGGIVDWLIGAGKKVVGFVINDIGKLFSFSLSTLWGTIVSTAQFIWNFNWNATDEELDRQVQTQWNALAGMLGGTIGNSVGYLICGALPGAALFTFNESMGLYVLEKVGEEALEELAGNVAALVRATIRTTVRTGFTFLFKNVRTLLKNPDNPVVNALFGDKFDKALKSWGEKGAKPWSFALATEAAIESIPNEALRNFIEEFLEEAWEGCVEAGYIVANSIETYLARQKAASPLGTDKVVQVTPNRQNKDEYYLLAGSSELLRPTVVNLLTTHQLINEHEIGTSIDGTPVFDYMRAKPMTLSIRLELATVDSPPWNRSSRKVMLSIPDVERSKMDYQTLRTTCGGSNGFTYGPYWANYPLDNGRNLWAYGSSENEAEQQLNRMLLITSAKPLTATPKAGRLSKKRHPVTNQIVDVDPVRVYAKKIYVINQEKTLRQDAILTQTGNYSRKKMWLWIYEENEPSDFAEKLQYLLSPSL